MILAGLILLLADASPLGLPPLPPPPAPPPSAAPAPAATPAPAVAPAALPKVVFQPPPPTVGKFPPFPPPKVTVASPQLKCDWGSLLSVDAKASKMLVQVPDGVVTYLVASTFPVVAAKDGRPVGPVSSLQRGQQVRVYYVVDRGAKVLEVDSL